MQSCHGLGLPGKAKVDVAVLSRPTALASSSTDRISEARGLCIHIVPTAQFLLRTMQTDYTERIRSSYRWTVL